MSRNSHRPLNVYRVTSFDGRLWCTLRLSVQNLSIINQFVTDRLLEAGTE